MEFWIVIGQWILANGYAIMFVGMLFEGPVATSAGAFAARLALYNVWIVFIISILGNLIPDIIYYAIGYWGREKILARWGHKFGFSGERAEKMENLFKTHPGKTLLASKLIPAAAIPGLIAAGAAKMPLKNYICWSLAIILPTSLFFLAIGYYFGSVYKTIANYVEYGGYLIAAFLILVLAIYYVYKKVGAKIGEKIEKI